MAIAQQSTSAVWAGASASGVNSALITVDADTDHIVASVVAANGTNADQTASAGGVAMRQVLRLASVSFGTAMWEVVGKSRLPLGPVPVTTPWASHTRLATGVHALSGTRYAEIASGNSNSGTGSSTATNTTACTSPAAAGNAQISCFHINQNATFTPNSSQTPDWTFAGAGGLSVVGGHLLGVGSGSNNSQWTASTTGNVVQMVAAIAPSDQGVSSLSPANGATGVAVGANLVVTYSATPTIGTGNIVIYEAAAGTDPVVAATANDSQAASATTFVQDIAQGTGLGAGDFIFQCAAKDDDDPVTAIGSEGFDWWATLAGGTAVRAVALGKIATGSEGTTNTLTGDSEGWIGRSWRILAANLHATHRPVVVAKASTASTTIDPPSITPPWTGPTRYLLWIGLDNTGTVGAYPANADGGTTGSTTNGTECWQIYAEHYSSTGGAFTFDDLTISASEEHVIYVAAIPGADPSTAVKTIAVTDGSQVSVSGNDLIINPTADLDPSKTYFALVPTTAVVGSEGIWDRSQWTFSTAASGGAMVADLPAALDVSGTLLGAGALAGDIPVAMTLSGALSGAGALAADLPAELALSGELTGSGALSGDLPAALALAGELTGAGALTADAPMALDFAGTLTGTGAMVADMPGALVLTGALTALSPDAMVADIPMALVLSGALTGSGAMSGALTGALTLSGTLRGLGAPRLASVRGTLSRSFPGVRATLADSQPGVRLELSRNQRGVTATLEES